MCAGMSGASSGRPGLGGQFPGMLRSAKRWEISKTL